MEKRTLIFLHIPKTGGTTFRVLLEKEYGLASDKNWEKGVCHLYATHGNFNIWDLAYKCKAVKPEVLVGHFTYGIHRIFDGLCDYVTILRNPVDRIVSNYTWAIQNVNILPQFSKYKNWTLDQYLEESFLKNAMTRCLVYRECTIPESEWLKIAKNNLENFTLFGITEFFSEFIKVGTKIFNWQKTTDYTVENASIIKIKPTKEQIKLIEKECELDLELYEYAKKLFHEKFSNRPD